MVGVLVIHVAAAPVLVSDHSVQWWVVNAYDSASRWAVPVFFLLSGMLLLDPTRDESAADFYRKRLARIGWPVLAWTAFYAAFFAVRRGLRGDPATARDVADRILAGEAHFHLWYLYALLPMYLLVPALRRFVRAAGTGPGLVVCGLGFAASGAELWFRGTYGITHGPVWVWWLQYLPWFLAGPFLARLDAGSGRRVAWVVAVGASAATAIGCGLFSEPGVLGAGHYFYVYLSVTTIPASIAVFHLLRGWGAPVAEGGVVDRVATTSLGVYLLHPVLLDGLRFAGVRAERWLPAVSVPVLVGVLLVVSLVLVEALGRSSLTRRLV